MATYLTETVYQRWYRQHQINLGYCIDLLNHLRSRLETLPYDSEVTEIENAMNDIDNNLEQVRPRDFSRNPLIGMEMFFENIKVLVNLLSRLVGRRKAFIGIYQSEKERVLKNHQEFKFKDNLKQIRERIEAMEEKEYSYRSEAQEEQVAEQKG